MHFENVLLRMPDGVRLNAILYLPTSVKSGTRVGTQLSSDPYRTEPNGWAAKELVGWAQDGFCGMYLDVRGSGGSEGVPADEYTPTEYDDLVHVIDWLSRQPWSNGAVGMYGTSYSAFNSIWTAAYYKPPALKAIFVRGGTDDRYTDDIHSPGGILMMTDNSWALGMITENSTPGAPYYDLHGKAAMDRWNTPPWLGLFLNNQLDGPHYRRGSLAPDQYGLLTTPTYLAGGYRDMYQNFVPRIMKHAPALTHGILGPWHHSMTWPGPVLNWRVLQSRWFDHFLNGRDNGVLAEPRVSFYMPQWRRQKFRDPGPIPGEWRFADKWPDSVFAPGRKFFLRPAHGLSEAAALRLDPAPGQGGDLAELAPEASALALRYHPATGGFSESIGPSGYEGYYGIDSREDDSWGLSFDSPPLTAPLEILGFVKARLYASATAPQANWIVRVNDVAPDGTSYIVTYGFLNGTHRHSHTHPEPLVTNQMVELAFELFCTGYRFSPGHRIRIVVTNAYFPVVWPSPYPMTTTLFTGGDHASYVALPVLAPMDSLPGHLPVLSDRLAPEDADEGMTSYRLSRDLLSGKTSVQWQMGADLIGCEVTESDPAHASLTVSTREQFHPLGGGRTIESHTEGALRSTQDRFHMQVTCTLSENGKIARSRQWVTDVQRQLV
ncbi:MAG: CocE/NonD family hydrolase [Rhodospirillales bacterium]